MGGRAVNTNLLHFKNCSDNLFRIFGTHKLLRVFSPSLRAGPFTGLEWSFLLRDEGFDCDGNKIVEDDLELTSQPLTESEPSDLSRASESDAHEQDKTTYI